VGGFSAVHNRTFVRWHPGRTFVHPCPGRLVSRFKALKRCGKRKRRLNFAFVFDTFGKIFHLALEKCANDFVAHFGVIPILTDGAESDNPFIFKSKGLADFIHHFGSCHFNHFPSFFIVYIIA
jgi:hypothetical protein